MSTTTLPATLNGAGGLPAFEIDHDAVLKAVGLNLRDPNAQALLLTCQRYGLDPVLKHMVLISSRPYITRDGLLHVAHRSGNLDGIVVEDQGETPTHWTAKVSVYRKDMGRPFAYVGRYPKSGHLKTYGPEMAVKCAEVMALRRAFDVSLCAREELWDQEDVPADGPAHAALPAPGAHHAKNHNNDTGHGSGAYAAPEVVADFRKWARDLMADRNGRWEDTVSRLWPAGFDVPAKLHLLMDPWQLANHLFKWARERGLVHAPADAKQGQKPGFLGVAWERHREAIQTEAADYLDAVWAEKRALIDQELGTQEPPVAPEDESQDMDPDDDLPADFDATEAGAGG